MGGLFSRQTIVVDLTQQYSSELKELEGRILQLQQKKQLLLSRQRTLTRSLILYGTAVWLLVLLACLYIIDFPNRSHVVAKGMKFGPIVMWPVLLFLLKSALDSYFTLHFQRSDRTLAQLEKDKTTKLEELMAKTNFKATQQLISQFSEKKKPQQQQQQQPPSTQPTKQGPPAGSPMRPVNAPGQQQQQQQQQAQMMMRTPAGPKVMSQTMPASAFKAAQQQQQFAQAQQQQQAMMMQQQMQAQQQAQMQAQQYGGASAPPPMSDAIGSRSSLDRILDFVLGDGPANKYALICHVCAGHNGLVREQEVGKLRFKCAMCGALNGPPLPPNATVPPTPAAASHSRSSSTTSSLAAPAGDGSSSSGNPPLTPFAPLPRERRTASLDSPAVSIAARLAEEPSAAAGVSDDDDLIERGDAADEEAADEVEKEEDADAKSNARRRRTRASHQQQAASK